MNTYSIKSAKVVEDLSQQDQELIHEALADAIKHDLYICIQGNTHYWDDEPEYQLYGIYTMTHEEVHNYYANGGLWEYFHPLELMEQFITA